MVIFLIINLGIDLISTYCVQHKLNEIGLMGRDTGMVKPGFYAVPPQNIFEISPGFQQS